MSSLIAAARVFLQHESARAPDFSGCLILLPHHHAGQAFRKALLALLPGRYLLPPRLLTLPELAAGAGLGEYAEADSLRLALLHDFLVGSGRLPHHVEWPAAQELLALINDLDAHLLVQSPAQAAQADAAPLAAAGGDNRYLALEAGLADAVWRALSNSGQPGRMRLYAARLAKLAESAAQPLYCVGLAGLSGVEQAFLHIWQQRQPVITLPAAPPDTARLALMQTVWMDATATLAARGAAFAEQLPASPLGQDVRLFAAPGLEAAALSAEQVLTQWLAAGWRDIALIAPDRLMARRLRALLERRGILVQDETGWTFATAAVSHVLERWLKLVGDAFAYNDLLDLLKSPFVFADAEVQRLQAAHELDEAYRRHGAPDRLAGHIALAERCALPASLAVLRRIQAARADWSAKPLAQARMPLAEWTRRLLASLVGIGADAPLRADPVGAQLVRLLETLTRDSAGHASRYALADWRRWLFLQLEQATFSDTGIVSPIRLTHLAAAHTRDLDAAIVLGVGAAHLPGKPTAAIFNDAVRSQLGLPGAREKELLARAALTDLLARVPRVALVWQSEIDGEAAPLSPWLLQLEALHQAAWGRGLARGEVVSGHVLAAATAPEAPVWPHADAAPARLNVSAWQSLVTCPYQFFARHLLHLNERDDVAEEMDKRDYGSLVHAILARFHRAYPVLAAHAAAELSAALHQFSLDGFAAAEAEAYLASAWRQRWSQHIESYLAWALNREAEGYRFESAETPFARDVVWAEGHSTRLEGRADRVDRHVGLHSSTLALLDYKTQSRQTLNKKLAPDGEDVQLTAYAWLADASGFVTEAGFVTLDADKVENLDWKSDLPAAAQAEGERLHTVLAGLAQGSPLPAQGTPHACAWCEMRGLCRREHCAELT